MKIRTGFVSNSSSSSFIIHFPEKIETKEQLISYANKEMFKDSGTKFVESIDWIFKNMTLLFDKNSDSNNIVKFLFRFDDFVWDDNVNALYDCEIDTYMNFCEYFDINEDDVINKSPYENINNIMSLNASNKSNSYLYYVKTYDNTNDLVADLQYGGINKLFYGKVEQWSN